MSSNRQASCSSRQPMNVPLPPAKILQQCLCPRSTPIVTAASLSAPPQIANYSQLTGKNNEKETNCHHLSTTAHVMSANTLMRIMVMHDGKSSKQVVPNVKHNLKYMSCLPMNHTKSTYITRNTFSFTPYEKGILSFGHTNISLEPIQIFV